jgi:D-xylose transport system permease protein
MPGVPASGQTAGDTRRVLAARVAHWYARRRTAAVGVVMVLVWILFDAFNSSFLTTQNIAGLIDQIVPVAVLSIGTATVLLSGEIDLSGAAVGGVSAALVARLSVNAGLPLALALVLGLALACAITVVEALIVTRIGVPSFIATLGGMIALGGVLLLVLPSTFEVNLAGTSLGAINTTTVPAVVGYILAPALGAVVGWRSLRQKMGDDMPRSRRLIQAGAGLSGTAGLVAIGVMTAYVLGQQGGIPVPVLVMVALVIAGEMALRRSSYGVHLLAVGGSRPSARRAGISTRRVVIGAFVVLGTAAFLSGLFSASLDLGVSASSGPSSEVLDAIAAVVVGGTSLFGGRGSITSALIGAALIGSITNGLLLLGVSVAMQSIVTGLILVAAVSVDMLFSRTRSNRELR